MDIDFSTSFLPSIIAILGLLIAIQFLFTWRKERKEAALLEQQKAKIEQKRFEREMELRRMELRRTEELYIIIHLKFLLNE